MTGPRPKTTIAIFSHQTHLIEVGFACEGCLGNSEPQKSDRTQTLTIHVWYIYLHLPYFTIKIQQM